MTRIRWSLALLALGLGAAELLAQVPLVPFYYGFAGRGRTIHHSRYRHHRGFSLSLGLGAFIPPPYAFGPVYYPPVPRVTILYYNPPPPVLVVPQAPLLQGLPPDIFPGNRLELPPPPLPGDDGDLPPVNPDNRGRARPLPPEEPKPLPPPEKPRPPEEPRPLPRKEDDKPPRPAPPRRPPELPRPPQPEGDPRAESARLLEEGRKAFAGREIGRAVQRFRRATQVTPNEPTAHFLLGQSLFALGKYHDAVEAIRTGMALQPDWPNARFRPIELYGANPADYPDHLRRLQDTLERHPNDPVLLFLNGHQLWFDGRKDEARLLFLKARPRAADPGVIDRFLRALPGAPVV